MTAETKAPRPTPNRRLRKVNTAPDASAHFRVVRGQVAAYLLHRSSTWVPNDVVSDGSKANAEDKSTGLTLVLVEPAAQVRGLYTYLRRDPDLRGSVRLLESAPPPGTLGPVAEAVEFVTGSPELVATVAGVVIAWLRYRTSDVKLTVKRSDGTEVTVTANRVRTLSNEQTRAIMSEVQDALRSQSPTDAPEG